MDTPVAFFIFNRPDLTRLTFQRIAEARPQRLFIVADGPRPNRPDDVANCEAARAAVADIGWPCEVMRNYSPRNLGCGQRVASGLDWVFARTDRAIVVEDDCLPAPEFFTFCHEMLERYADAPEVAAVAGTNFLTGRYEVAESYVFSRYCHLWGWATWRRAWAGYDFGMAGLGDMLLSGRFEARMPDDEVARRWFANFTSVLSGQVDTWDFQFFYMMLQNDMLSVVPQANLVTNLGCGRMDATHTVADSALGGLPAKPMRHPLIHPDTLTPFALHDHLEDRLMCG